MGNPEPEKKDMEAQGCTDFLHNEKGKKVLKSFSNFEKNADTESLYLNS